MLKSAIWWTTMACNFKCKYCWEVQAQERGEFKPVPFRPAQDWLEAWNRLRPQLLDITGGEPFLMPDLLDVLIGLDPTIRVAITSNLSHPLLEFVKRVSPERVINVTASFHPMENGTRTHPIDHINVQPDGSAWRCILERQLGINPLGNVFDPGFALLVSPLPCEESWQCPACDRDKVTIIKN